MAKYFVAVADSVFPNLDPATKVLSEIGAELKLAADSSPESVMKIAAGADAVLVTYAKITGDMIRQMKKCRIISRFGIGVDNVDLEAATEAGIVVTEIATPTDELARVSSASIPTIPAAKATIGVETLTVERPWRNPPLSTANPEGSKSS